MFARPPRPPGRLVAALLQEGVALHRAGRLREAERIYRQVLAQAPGQSDAWHLLALLADQAGRAAPALDAARRAVALNPGEPQFHLTLARLLARAGRGEEGVESCRAALRLRPGAAEIHGTLGNALAELGRFEEAAVAYRAALALAPALPGLHNNLGIALRDANRLDEAEAALREAIRREPDDPQVRSNHANVLRSLGRAADAEAAFRAAIARRPDDAALRWNLSLCLLLTGQYAEGWAEYEHRWASGTQTPRRFAQPLWDGGALGDGTLLLHCEQGFGDTLQFCRYVPLAAERARVVLEAPPSLVRLLSGLPGVARVVAAGDRLPDFAAHCPLMSLPHVFGTRMDSIPAAVPYLHADPEVVAAWRGRLDGLPGLRVGLVWSGGPGRRPADRHRSIAPARLAALAGVPGVSFVSLQKPPAPGLAPDNPLAAGMTDWTGALHDWADTAALVAALDLVIGIDTGVTHLAGALGRPVWLLNRLDTCWRWLLEREDSPWYPTMRLFRQETAGDWDGVLRRVRGALTARAAAGR